MIQLGKHYGHRLYGPALEVHSNFVRMVDNPTSCPLEDVVLRGTTVILRPPPGSQDFGAVSIWCEESSLDCTSRVESVSSPGWFCRQYDVCCLKKNENAPLLFFLTFSALVANPKKLKEIWQRPPPPHPFLRAARLETNKK